MEIVDPRVDLSLLPEGSVARIVNGPQREWLDLPAVITPIGQVITRWTFTAEERAAIAGGEDVFVTIINGRRPLAPIWVAVGPCDWVANENALLQG